MNTQEKVALESLIAKLNSLRKTLNDEEREILDAMVITEFDDEINLHRFDEVTPKADSSAMPKVDQRADMAADDEVTMHRYDQEVTPKVDSAFEPKVDHRADMAADEEVTMHRYDQEVTPKVDSAFEPKVDQRVDQAADDEVTLHRYDQKVDNVISPSASRKAQTKIIFDPETETYKVVGRAID